MAVNNDNPSTVSSSVNTVPDGRNMDTDRLLSTGKIFSTDDQTLNLITRGAGFSEFGSALTSSLYGIDIQGTGTPAQQVQEQHGLVFFTRPLLNLSYYNLQADRVLMPMRTKRPNSVAAYVRAMLDPIGRHTCPLVDNDNPFIPILSNTIETLTGFQDPILDTYTSASNKERGQWSIGDSSNKVYGTYELSSSFRNIRGSFLFYLFHVWQTYISRAYAGKVDPYPEFIVKNVIDYQTRIYRLILDPTRTFVEDVVCGIASFPLVSPVGVRANLNRAEPMNNEIDMISQSWRTMGARYFDELNRVEFNRLPSLLNPAFSNDIEIRKRNYRRLWPVELKTFSYMAYPQINAKTSRLEWWVSKANHRAILGSASDTYDGYNIDD